MTIATSEQSVGQRGGVSACIITFIYVHTRILIYIYILYLSYKHTYIHACIHTYIHTYIHAHLLTYKHTYSLKQPRSSSVMGCSRAVKPFIEHQKHPVPSNDHTGMHVQFQLFHENRKGTRV